MAIDEWCVYLSGLTPAQIKHGLDSWKADWPPSSVEFKASCIGASTRLENSAMYRQFKALPRPPADKEKAREQLDIMRRSAGCIKQ